MGRRRRKDIQADKRSSQTQSHDAGQEEEQIATLPLQTVPVSLSLPHDLHQDTLIDHGGTFATYNDTDVGPAGDTQLLPDDAAAVGVLVDAKGQDLQDSGNPLRCIHKPVILAGGGNANNEQTRTINDKDVPDSDATTEEGNGPDKDDNEDETCCAESARIDDDTTRTDGLGSMHAEKAQEVGFKGAEYGSGLPLKSAAAIRAASLRTSGLRSAARNSSNSCTIDDAMTEHGSHATVELHPAMVIGASQVQNSIKEQPFPMANIHDSPNNEYIMPDVDSETTVEVNPKTIKAPLLEGTNVIENASDSMPNSFLKKPTCQAFTLEEEHAAAVILKPAGEEKHGLDKVIKYSRNTEARKPHYSSRKCSPDVEPEVPKTDTKEFGENLPLDEQTGAQGIDEVLQQTVCAYQASGGGGSKPSGTLAASTELSYLDSHEPGDETQLDALNAVEKLVWLNASGLSQDVGANILPEQATAQGNKGPTGFQSLAHTAEVKNMQDKMGIYEYPDSQMVDSNPLPGVKVGRNFKASKGRKRKIGSNDVKVHSDLRTVNRTKGAAASKIAARTETATSDGKLLSSDAEPHTLLTTRLKESSRKRKAGVKGEENDSKSDAVLKKNGRKRKAFEVSSRPIEEQASLASSLNKKPQLRESVVQKDEKELSKASKNTTKTDAANMKETGGTEASRDLKSPTNCMESDTSLTRRLKERSTKRKKVVGKEEKDSRLNDVPKRNAGKRKGSNDSISSKDQAITSSKSRKVPHLRENITLKDEKESPKLHVTNKGTTEAVDSRTVANDDLIGSGDRKNWREKAGDKKFDHRRATRNQVHEGGLGSKPKASKQSSLEEDTRPGTNGLKGVSNSARAKRKAVSSGWCDDKESKLETEVEERKGSDLHAASTGTKRGLKARMKNQKVSQDLAKKGSEVHSDILDGDSPDMAVPSEQKSKQDNRGRAMPSKEKITKEMRKTTPSKLDSSPLIVEGRRKKRDTGCMWVLFSHSLPEDTKKQQQKLLAKLGGHLASSVAESSHFVSNGFVRTRNMLESIATGKPVVTPQWLESCVQAHYVVDEKNYILQDAKKEKEIGFSMHSSLAAAQRRPLLKGMNVLVSPNTTPDVKSVTSIVRSAGGAVLQSTQKFGNLDVAANNFIVADEKDAEFCHPLLERGFKAYSAELVLNGIVVQNLDFSRYQIFKEYQS